MIIWAGTSNKDVGMVIEHYPGITIPTRKMEVQQVPGRNGDILFDTGAFENYDQSYSAFLDAKYIGGLEAAIPKITSWLLGHSGYQKLEDSYFPDVYRMAYYAGGAQFVNIFNEYGEGTLTFKCAPEKYYKFGEKKIPVTKGMSLVNPSSFPSNPLYIIRGSGDVTLHIGGNMTPFVLRNMVGNPDDPNHLGARWYIDVKNHNVYAEPLTDYISVDWEYSRMDQVEGNFENLKLGKNTSIDWEGNIGDFEIVPNWWTI